MFFKVLLSLAVLALSQALIEKGPGVDIEINGIKYFVSDESGGALESFRVCDGKGMHFVNLETRNESEALFAWLQSQPDQVDKVFWSGGSRRSGSDVWVWTVGGDVNIDDDHWAVGYPQVELEFDAEITIQGSLGGWSDASTFGMKYHQLCELYEGK